MEEVNYKDLYLEEKIKYEHLQTNLSQLLKDNFKMHIDFEFIKIVNSYSAEDKALIMNKIKEFNNL